MKLCAKGLHWERKEPVLGAGKGWGQELRGAGAAWEGPAAGLGWADGNSRKPKRV